MNALQVSHNPLYDMTTGIVRKSYECSEKIERRIIDHVYAFIIHHRPIPSLLQNDPLTCRLTALRALQKWADITKLILPIKGSFFLQIKQDSEIKSLLLGDGICTGIVLSYFSKFFKDKASAFLKSSPFSYIHMKLTQEECEFGPFFKGRFYRFQLKEELLEEQTKTLRFLHAAYKVADRFKSKASLEYVPSKILKNLGLELIQRIPQESNHVSFAIEELLEQIKQLADQDKEPQGYLLGIGNESGDKTSNHALALHLQFPFHFMDPSTGIGVADSLDDLAIFLASYLTSMYPTHQNFAFLKFAPTIKYVPPKKIKMTSFPEITSFKFLKGYDIENNAK